MHIKVMYLDQTDSQKKSQLLGTDVKNITSQFAVRKDKIRTYLEDLDRIVLTCIVVR